MKDNKEKMMNYISNEEDAPSKAQMIAQTYLWAKTNNRLLMHTDVRYAVAGDPSVICDDYIHYDASKSYDIGRTGKIGGKAPEVEHNPYPRGVSMDAILSWEAVDIVKTKV